MQKPNLIKLFGEKALYVEYTDPGYVLFKKVDDKIKAYRAKFNEEPNVIWLQNHGIFVAANTIEEIKNTYDEILTVLNNFSTQLPVVEAGFLPSEGLRVTEVIPAIRMMVSNDSLKTLKVRQNELIRYYSDSIENQKDISKPFTPDAIVYCKSNYIFLNGETSEAILEEAINLIPAFTEKFSYHPKVLLIRGIGLVAVGDNAKQCDVILDVFEDAMK